MWVRAALPSSAMHTTRRRRGPRRSIGCSVARRTWRRWQCSEHTKYTAASCGAGNDGSARPRRPGRPPGRQLTQGLGEPVLGQRPGVHALREAGQVRARGVELVDEAEEGERFRALRAGGRRERSADTPASSCSAPSRAARAAADAASSPASTSRRREAATSRMRAASSARSRTFARTSRTAATTDCAKWRRAARWGRDERGHGRPAVLDEGDHALVTLLRKWQLHRLPGLVDPAPRPPGRRSRVRDRRLCSRARPAGPAAPDGRRDDDQPGRRRAHRAARERVRERARPAVRMIAA